MERSDVELSQLQENGMPISPEDDRPGSLAEQMFSRFRGLDRAHGHYTPQKAKKPGSSKLDGTAATVRKPVTVALFHQHIAGTYGLGIVPIAEDCTCRWGAIDIDRYEGLDLAGVEAEITRRGLPLVIVTSKSGGLHLYLFCRVPIPAELVRTKLADWARALGHPHAEIFPKQTRLAPDDTGNWINLPYFGLDTGNRQAIRAGERLTLQEFLDWADSAAVDRAELEALKIVEDPGEDDFLFEAPPCLQRLAKEGCGEGSRNLGLYNLGVYLRKRYGEGFDDKLDDYNHSFMDPPVRHKEVAQIAKNVAKKNYNYKCKEPPINALCDRERCLTRKHGIGDGTMAHATTGPSDRPTVLGVLLDLLNRAGAELWHTNNRRAWVSLTIRDNREHWPIESTDFRRFLVHGYYRAAGKAIAAEALQNALRSLDARATNEGSMHHVVIRVAEVDGGIYIDLNNPQREIVYIHAEGWQIVRDAPVRFHRPPTLRPLPRPERGGTVDALRPFVTIRDEGEWRLLVGFLVSCLRANGPYPQLHLTGVQGSAKTTLARMIVRMIDPSMGGVRAVPRDERDLVIAATQSHLLAFDNVSSLEVDMSDALCRLSTGGGLGTRKLWTNDEEQVFDVVRPVVLNGIAEIGIRPDLRDRAFILDLPRLDDEDRKDEATLWAAFESALPTILGALYDAVSCALGEWDSTVLASVPRLADMARWVEAAGPALGWEPGSFLALYRIHREQSARRAVEQDAVASTVLGLVSKRDYRLSPMELLKALTDVANSSGLDIARQPYWPKTPRALTLHLKRIKPDLEKFGVTVEWGRGEERWIWVRSDGRGGEPITTYEPSM